MCTLKNNLKKFNLVYNLVKKVKIINGALFWLEHKLYSN